jgi:hypothetical protein
LIELELIFRMQSEAELPRGCVTTLSGQSKLPHPTIADWGGHFVRDADWRPGSGDGLCRRVLTDDR